MIVSKTIEIDAGHRVPNHKSKCKNIHGHRYVIEAIVEDRVITKKGSSDEGMVIDFGDLKEVMMDVIDKDYDHGFIISEEDPFISTFESLRDEEEQKVIVVPFVPTAENLAEHWFKILEERLEKKGIELRGIEVKETPSSTAIYTEE